jgi:1-acyl-sn-glycerol-3-phosphate acyltransferase
MRAFLCLCFRLSGWKTAGRVPREIPKFIIAVAPHSSNWDFLVGLGARACLNFQSYYLGKKELFDSPLGWMFRRLGGIPVDRSRKSDLVEEITGEINRHEQFILTIAPEGTRKQTGKWKSGFYHIAHNARIPIVFCAFDYPTKTVRIFEPFTPSGNLEDDSTKIAALFADSRGKHRGISPVC